MNAAADAGMQPAVWAQLQPDRVAIYDYTGQDRTFGQLNANANRIARLLRAAGLKAGDSVALACSNRAEFCDVLMGVAAAWPGMRCTPVNWHLTGDEIAYVVQDCEAKAFFADTRIARAAENAAAQCPNLVLKLAIGGPVAGFDAYDAALAPLDGSDIESPERGYTMLYTSGTTGRPKGVFKPGLLYGAFQPEADRENDIYLCTGPAYHAAPLAGNVRAPLLNGLPIVFLDKWDSEGVLREIETRRITHSRTSCRIMLQRACWRCRRSVRGRYDLSSLKRINHGAARRPPDVKRAMIEMAGTGAQRVLRRLRGRRGLHGAVGGVADQAGHGRPAAISGGGQDRQRRRRGVSAGRRRDHLHARAGDRLPVLQGRQEDPGLAARRLLHPRRHRLSRRGRLPVPHRPQRRNHHRRRARSTSTPRKLDNELIKHPAVADSCTIGVPHDEYGEEVRAVIQLKSGFEPSEAIRGEILAFAAATLAKFKIPRGLDFVEELPRSAAGKILRGRVREPYWAGRARQI